MKSKFEYLSTMNLYLLISAKKQIFADFQYLVCLNKVLQSLSFHIPCRGKVTKVITSNYIFPSKNFNPIVSNPNYSFRVYHVSLNLVSHDIDIISADISNFGDLAIFVMSKDFLTWKWSVFWRHFLYAVMSLSGLAITFCHAVFILSFKLPLQSKRMLYFHDFI